MDGAVLAVVLISLLPVFLLRTYAQKLSALQQRRRAHLLYQLGADADDADAPKKRIVGFFHPYCNAGGGGERVLWAAVTMIQRKDPDIVCVVYTGDTDATKEEIIAQVKARFEIALDPSSLHFVFLENRRWVEDSAWPRFTLLGQSVGSMYLAWEAMRKLMPDLYIDTMGYAFTFHVVALLSALAGKPVPIGAYVHYPTISTSMLSRVRTRTSGHTNSSAVASSGVLSWGKLLYYRIFMHLYAGSLARASFLMVNSSWTQAHVDAVFAHRDAPVTLAFTLLPLLCPPLLLLRRILRGGTSRKAAGAEEVKTQVVYPACDTRAMGTFPLEGRERTVLSIAQFRPEKDHQAQLRAFAALLDAHPEHRAPKTRVELVLVGGSRNAGDAARVESLRALAAELKIEEQTRFVINAAYPEMLALLARASVGLSTMVDEHFGINVVELMAAGVIPVAHASGGPLQDIIVPVDGEPTGFHATDPASFADALHSALSLPPAEALAMRARARGWAVQRFSEAEFERTWEESGWRKFLSV